jgi:hypothetical protein
VVKREGGTSLGLVVVATAWLLAAGCTNRGGDGVTFERRDCSEWTDAELARDEAVAGCTVAGQVVRGTVFECRHGDRSILVHPFGWALIGDTFQRYEPGQSGPPVEVLAECGPRYPGNTPALPSTVPSAS